MPSDDEKETIKKLSKSLHEAKREHKRVNHDLETLFESYQERGDTVQFRTKVASIVDSRSNYNVNTFIISRDSTEVELNRYHTVEMHSETEAEKLASFLEDFGDEYVGGDKLRNLELPSDLDEFRAGYEDLKQRSDDLSASIDEDMEALNDAVYETYGIEEYQDDIEEYLDSFLTVIQ